MFGRRVTVIERAVAAARGEPQQCDRCSRTVPR